MTTYWITFRIADEAVRGRTYSDRYDGFTSAVVAECSNFWAETTSFYIFESTKSIDSLAKELKAEISTTTDLFVIQKLGEQSARMCGVNHDEEILTLMPYLKAV